MTATNPHSSPKGIAAPDFWLKISLDRKKQHPYTPSVRKEVLI
jgi:hypothetical protein